MITELVGRTLKTNVGELEIYSAKYGKIKTDMSDMSIHKEVLIKTKAGEISTTENHIKNNLVDVTV